MLQCCAYAGAFRARIQRRRTGECLEAGRVGREDRLAPRARRLRLAQPADEGGVPAGRKAHVRVQLQDEGLARPQRLRQRARLAGPRGLPVVQPNLPNLRPEASMRQDIWRQGAYKLCFMLHTHSSLYARHIMGLIRGLDKICASSSQGGMLGGKCCFAIRIDAQAVACLLWAGGRQSSGLLATHSYPPARAERRTWLFCDAGIGSSIMPASVAASTCHTMPTLTLPGWDAFCSRSCTVQRASASLKAAMDTKICSAGLLEGCGHRCAFWLGALRLAAKHVSEVAATSLLNHTVRAYLHSPPHRSLARCKR